MELGRQVVATDGGVSRGATAARWLAALALVVLSACEDTPPPQPPAPPPRVATWRVVVWGAGPEADPQLHTAIAAELLKRAIATKIVDQAGPVNHVLEVEIKRKRTLPKATMADARSAAGARHAPLYYFEAEETVRNGNDTSLAVQRIVQTGAPGADVPPDILADPTRALAFQIGTALK